MVMVVRIQSVVLLCILLRVSTVDVDGLMKSVSFVTWRSMPGGNVLVSAALSIICLWCIACISLKYCLLVCLVSGSGGWVSGVGLGICVGVLRGGCISVDISGCGVGVVL